MATQSGCGRDTDTLNQPSSVMQNVFQNEFMEMLSLRIWRRKGCPNQGIGHIDFRIGHRKYMEVKKMEVRRVQGGAHMYTRGGFILIFGKTNTIMYSLKIK